MFQKIKCNKRKLSYYVVMETRLNPFDQSVRVNGLRNENFWLLSFLSQWAVFQEAVLKSAVGRKKKKKTSLLQPDDSDFHRLSEKQFAQPEERRLNPPCPDFKHIYLKLIGHSNPPIHHSFYLCQFKSSDFQK